VVPAPFVIAPAKFVEVLLPPVVSTAAAEPLLVTMPVLAPASEPIV
jgi:hypothetical protein